MRCCGWWDSADVERMQVGQLPAVEGLLLRCLTLPRSGWMAEVRCKLSGRSNERNMHFVGL